MPRFEVRLESPDRMQENGKPHFRVFRLVAADEDAARAAAERSEMRQVLYQLPPDELARVEAIEADPEEKLDGADKGRLYTHRQERAYEVTSVRALGG